MRIIDKNTDFYDYLQNVYPDSSLTFDRTDSFLLTKEMMCSRLMTDRRYHRRVKDYALNPYNFLVLQICNTFWLFLVEITKVGSFDNAIDYNIELLSTWKNYNKSRILIKIDVIRFRWDVNARLWRKGYNKSELSGCIDVLKQAVDTNDYLFQGSIDRQVVYRGSDRAEKHIPLLKACGIAQCLDPLDVFLSFEEYFSLEKSSTERREPVGTTDKDKLESHGFDSKTSFRDRREIV